MTLSDEEPYFSLPTLTCYPWCIHSTICFAISENALQHLLCLFNDSFIAILIPQGDFHSKIPLFLWIFSEPSAHQPKNNTPLKNLGCLLRFRAQMFYLISTFLDLYIVPISVMHIIHCTSLCASLYLLDDWCCFFLLSVCP